MNITGLGQCSLDNLFIVDSFPEQDTKKEVIEWTTAGGGPVATALVTLARLGMNCRFYGITGDDDEGRKIAASLQSEAIDIRGLAARPGSRSQVAFICVEQGSGKRTIFWKRPSCRPLSPDELPAAFLSDSDFLLVDGLMTEASIYAAKKAGEKGIPVMLDAGKVREGMIELAHMCDYVVCSGEFARELVNTGGKSVSGTGLSLPEKALEKMKRFGSRAVTVTLGDRGSMTLYGDEMFHTPAFHIDAVDTTGAGDVFHGGYVYGLLQQWDIRDVVRFASACAALKCRSLGGRDSIPGLAEVQALLNTG